MDFFTLCYPLVLLVVSSEPVWGQKDPFGIVKHLWRNGVSNRNRLLSYGERSSKKIEFHYARIPPKLFQSFILVDVTAQINNLVYLSVQKQKDRVSVAFESVGGAQNVFFHLYPNCAQQVDDILVERVVLQLGDGSLHQVATEAAFSFFHVDGQFVRVILHSRKGSKLPIAIFHSSEFNFRSIDDSRFVVLAVKPLDGEGEVFHYGLEFPSVEEKYNLFVQIADQVHSIVIHDELTARFKAYFNGEAIPPLAENYFVKRGTQLVAEFIV